MKVILNVVVCVVATLIVITACTQHQPEPAQSSREPQEATAWSQTTEAYLVVEPVSGGNTRSLTLFVTRLADGKPLTGSTPVLTCSPAGAAPVVVTFAASDTPGIYHGKTSSFPGMELPPMVLSLSSSAGKEQVVFGDHEDEHEEHHDDQRHEPHSPEPQQQGHAHAESGEIILPKNQQWAGGLVMAVPRRQKIAAGVTVTGELTPVSSSEAVVSAPMAGLVSLEKPLPFVGKQVRKGGVVALIEPPLRPEGGLTQLTAEHAQASSRLSLAKNEYERAIKLYEAKIAPAKRVEEARAALDAAQAAVVPLAEAMTRVPRGRDGRITVTAPVSGTVVEVMTTNGKGLEPGQPLLRIVDTGGLWLKVHIPASEADSVRNLAAESTTFTVAGSSELFHSTHIVSKGVMIDPQTRTLPVLLAVDNRSGRLKPGMFAQVVIRARSLPESLVVPKTALFEDEGRWFVFVQRSGVSFDRREVRPGAEDTGLVQILSGIEDHERIVIDGGYYVKLAAQGGGAPDPHAGHGH